MKDVCTKMNRILLFKQFNLNFIDAINTMRNGSDKNSGHYANIIMHNVRRTLQFSFSVILFCVDAQSSYGRICQIK